MLDHEGALARHWRRRRRTLGLNQAPLKVDQGASERMIVYVMVNGNAFFLSIRVSKFFFRAFHREIE